MQPQCQIPRIEFVDLEIQQGVTYVLTLLCQNPDSTPFDFSSCTAAMVFSQGYCPGPLYLTLTSSSGIALGENGVLQISLMPAQTLAFPYVEGVYALDVTLADTTVQRFLQGRTSLIPKPSASPGR